MPASMRVESGRLIVGGQQLFLVTVVSEYSWVPDSPARTIPFMRDPFTGMLLGGLWPDAQTEILQRR